MDDEVKESSPVKDISAHEESPPTVQHHPDFCAAPTPLSAIPLTSPHYNNPLYIPKQQIPPDASSAKRGRYESPQQIPTGSPNAKRGRYESPWRVVTHPSQPISFPPSLSPSHFTVQNPSSSSPTAQQPSSPSSSSKSQPSQEPTSTGQEINNKNNASSGLALRKGKYVSPVWKPYEMLWLARAWRIQYLGDPSKSQQENTTEGSFPVDTYAKQSKTRAEKDREVAQFLNQHGVNRDAKTAGTKWDNMLGEFRKVYEWEKGPEREEIGKSYFRLSPYERKLHRLPASFDEEVYEELAQFMGFRQRASQQKCLQASATRLVVRDSSKEFTPKENKDNISLMQVIVPASEPFTVPIQRKNENEAISRELHRIGKVKIIWEETAHIWAEEGEYQRGRLKVDQLNFLHANELTFFDETWTASTIEAFEGGALKGFSTDRFMCGQQLKVFGRRKAGKTLGTVLVFWGQGSSAQPQQSELSSTSFPPLGLRDRTDYFLGCLRVPAFTLPSIFELSSHLQEPPSKDMRFPVRHDVYEDLPTGKEIFFCPSSDTDCRAFMYEVVGPLLRPYSRRYGRESFIGLWDDCINSIINKFCAVEIELIRKSGYQDLGSQEQWPNVCGFVKNLCLWRGEETDAVREGDDPAIKIVEKLLWTYGDLPYVLGYYAVGDTVTFCALSKSHERVIRIDLVSMNLSTPAQRLKALVPCWRVSRILPLLADSCHGQKSNCIYSDYQILDRGSGKVIEIMPTHVKKIFPNRRKWATVKEIYDFLDNRIPHVEYIHKSVEQELALVFKPRGCATKPSTVEQLVEALKFVTKALVSLHTLSFMHRDLRWDNVMKNIESDEWFIIDFEDAIGAPQIYPHNLSGLNHAPEMSRGVHGVKVDVWSIGHLIRTSGLNVSELLRNLQNRCLEQDPDQRPSAADCYHHLLQLQSSLPNY